MDIGRCIRAARKGCGLSQTELAELAGISRSALVALESNRGAVSTLLSVRTHVGFRIVGLGEGKVPSRQLAMARKRRGLSVADVAAGAGVSAPTVRLLENGGGRVQSLSAVISFLAPKARANGWHRPRWQVRKDVRFTPPDLIAAIVSVFGPIDLDPAGDPRSFVNAQQVITEEEDGLSTRWSGRLAFVNPPYSDLARWMGRCCDAWDDHQVEQMLGLFPARTETVNFRTRIVGVADVLFLPRRLRFFSAEREELPPSPFALMLCVWGAPEVKVRKLAEALAANVMWASHT